MKRSPFQLNSRIPKFFVNAPIRTKLTIAFSLSFIIVLLLSTITLYIMSKRAIETHIESELHNSSSAILNMVQTAAILSIQTHLKTIADKNKEIVTALYQQALAGKMTETEARKRANQIIISQNIGKTGYIYCINSKGIIQVHPKRLLTDKDISGYPFVQQQVSKKDGYIEYMWKNPDDQVKRSKALYMTYFEPWDWIISATSYRGEFKDLISPRDFRESIMDLRFGETGYSYVIDSDGNCIIHPIQPNANIYNAKDSDGRYFIRQMIEQKNGRIIYPWQNPNEKTPREKLVIFNYLQEYDMIVASSSYLEEFYKPMILIRYIIISSVIITLLLLIPFNMWLGNIISRPLANAAERFQSAGEGDFSVRMDIQSMDEMGKMAIGFNGFMVRLENYRNELNNLNENLEERVQERTAELEKALDEVKTLSGLLPICASCKNVRDDTGYWQQIEQYIGDRSEAAFSHSICPDCMVKLYPDYACKKDKELKK